MFFPIIINFIAIICVNLIGKSNVLYLKDCLVLPIIFPIKSMDLVNYHKNILFNKDYDSSHGILGLVVNDRAPIIAF